MAKHPFVSDRDAFEALWERTIRMLGAYLRDLPQAELHLLDTGHFALEDKGTEIAQLMLDFLNRKLRVADR